MNKDFRWLSKLAWASGPSRDGSRPPSASIAGDIFSRPAGGAQPVAFFAAGAPFPGAGADVEGLLESARVRVSERWRQRRRWAPRPDRQPLRSRLESCACILKRKFSAEGLSRLQVWQAGGVS
jgi:hypothetical protein